MQDIQNKKRLSQVIAGLEDCLICARENGLFDAMRIISNAIIVLQSYRDIFQHASIQDTAEK